MSTLANQLAVAEREEVAQAIRLLVARPLLTGAAEQAGFEPVRRRREPLARWFDHTCGRACPLHPSVPRHSPCDDPVPYRAGLAEDELAYVTSLTGRQILRRSVAHAGLLLEERAEGFLLVDTDGITSDLRGVAIFL